jgi:membrane fusion protein, multidrug efflux system
MSATTYTDGSDGLMDEQRQADSARSNEPAKAPRRIRRIILVGGALLLIALVIGFLPQWRQRQIAASDTKQLAVSNVAVVSPAPTMPGSGLTLPAEVRPWLDTSIFAQVSGYLKTRLVDIGAHVEQGQLLAEIDTPDLNQQLKQARAQLQLAQTNFDLAKSTNDKFQKLFSEGVVSQLDSENAAAAQGVQAANLDNNKENVKRLEQLQGFQRVVAPFAGTITIRNVEVGDLINPSGGKEMFHIQQTQSLRVYFRVPQAEAPNIAVGQTFDVLVGTGGGKPYLGKVATTSEAVSPDSRTMQVELQVDNSQNEITAGSYATVRLSQSVLGKLLILPDNTLIFRGKNLQVAVVDAKGVVEVRDVKVGRDFGIQSEILGGVTESDKVIVNPSDSITTGTIVHVAATPAPSATPAASATPGSSAAPAPSATPVPSATQK